MTEAQFKAEKTYQTTMSLAEDLLKNGIISSHEYDDFNTRMVQKYQPIFGTLWSQIEWIKPTSYGKMEA